MGLEQGRSESLFGGASVPFDRLRGLTPPAPHEAPSALQQLKALQRLLDLRLDVSEAALATAAGDHVDLDLAVIAPVADLALEKPDNVRTAAGKLAAIEVHLEHVGIVDRGQLLGVAEDVAPVV